jgi:hypothetical protein
MLLHELEFIVLASLDVYDYSEIIDSADCEELLRGIVLEGLLLDELLDTEGFRDVEDMLDGMTVEFEEDFYVEDYDVVDLEFIDETDSVMLEITDGFDTDDDVVEFTIGTSEDLDGTTGMVTLSEISEGIEETTLELAESFNTDEELTEG